MTEDRGPDAADRDRELSELLSEFRVVLPAVTVLFAFLITVPFSSRFERLTNADQAAYFTAFLSTAVAIVLLVGVTSYHRLRGKPYDKGRMLHTASRQAVVAVALLGVSLTAVVFLVADVLYPGPTGPVVAAGLFALAAVTWFGLPLKRRRGGG